MYIGRDILFEHHNCYNIKSTIHFFDSPFTKILRYMQNARCGAEQTQTVTREAPTITHIPGNC